MKEANILVRVVSSIIVILLVIGFIYLWGKHGVFCLGVFFALCAVMEFQKLTFSHLGKLFRTLFVLFAVLLFGVSCMEKGEATLYLAIWGLSMSSFTALSVWQLRNKLSNEKLLSVLALSLLGFFYISLLPALALRLLFFPHGFFWFFSLLVVVLCGDTFSYMGGRLWGRRRLLSQISPKKTVEGALCGALGSLLGAGVLCIWSPIPPILLLVIAFVGSLLAQCGDLFESLIKRVKDVKDSGKLMPGHGGALDRIDGILFAAPVFLMFATFYS